MVLNALSPNDPGFQAREQREDAVSIRGSTIFALFSALIVTLILTMVAAWPGFATAFVLSIAFTTVGYIVGLLFSVPRALAVAADLSSASQTGSTPPTPPSSQTAQGQSKSTSSTTRSVLSVNTNLEQVSDWLTKIIVGVGLVEATRIANFVWGGAQTIGAGLVAASGSGLKPELADLVGLGMIIVYPSQGFLMGFLSVRLYISRAIWIADSELTHPYDGTSPYSEEVRRELGRPVAPTPSRGQAEGVATTTVPVSSAIVQQALDVPLEALTNVKDILARGRAAQERDLRADARAAFERALSLDPNNLDAITAYVQFLYNEDPAPYAKIITLLEDARRQFTSATPISLRRDITRDLLNAYLYTQAPNGFESANRLGDEYVSGLGAQDPDGYLYLAAAHGQAYRYWKPLDPNRAAIELTLTVETVRKAIAMGGDLTRSWLKALATGDAFDNDLQQAAADSTDLRDLLKLGPETE